MSAVGSIVERTDMPAYVRFKRVAVEDKAASLAKGEYVAKDVDYALITPPYSKDVHEVKVTQWVSNMEADVRNERLPKDWQMKYLASYEAWKNGQELPLEGTPIKAWGVISPAQQETLIRMSILTVEDLAGVNDEGMRRIGMGAVELKTKARAWLAQLKDKGPLTIEMAGLKAQNTVLQGSVESLMRQVAELRARIPELRDVPYSAPSTDTITANDILPESEPTERIRKK